MTAISLFTNRPLIVTDTVCIKIGLAAKSADIMLTFDWHKSLAINGQYAIYIQKGSFLKEA